MKRLLIILCGVVLSLQMWGGRHEYADHSVLRSGHIAKIRVSETGIYCLPYDTLKVWGFEPTEIRILGYGGNMLSENFTLPKWDDLPSVAFYMHKGSDGIFGKGDYILFYAQGPIEWQYKGGRWHHVQNPYSQYGYYFISDDVGEQRLMEVSEPLSEDNTYDVDWYIDYFLHEQDLINLIDRSGVSGGGREFYGEQLSSNQKALDVSFATTNVLTNYSIICYADVAATAQTPSIFKVSLANNHAKTSIAALPDFHTRAERDSIKLVTKPNTSANQKVRIEFSNSSEGAIGFLNYVELTVPRALIMEGRSVAINNANSVSRLTNTRYKMSNTSSSTQIWRVTDGVNICCMPTQIRDAQLTWIGGNQKIEKYMAVNVNATGWKIPFYMGEVENQDLHALQNIDYVIICPKDFVSPALRLAKKHEEKDNLTWAVVTDEQVYNEFSSGTPDVSAYRWLMKMLYDRAAGDKVKRPKHLLLMGSASFDNRGLLGAVSGVSRLLVYEAYNSTDETKAYATDDYCGFMADDAGVDIMGRFNEAQAKMDIGVGRLPVRTLEQANQVVDKICRYMDNANLGPWKSQICFLADDGDHGMHVQTAEAGANKIAIENPNFVLTKIYLDAHTQEVNASGESYPLAKSQFDNLISKGVLFMDYSGHGGYNNITSELIMRTRDIRNMQNVNQGFWFLATCNFSHFDAGVPSAGEEAVLNPNGGAIAVVSACRTVYVSQNTEINKHFCDTLFGHEDPFNYNMTLGDATRIAKNTTGRDMNKMPYILLGDPALRLNYPTNYQIMTTSKLDTLRALSVQTIKGYVMTEEGDTASWFNGPLHVTIWDKMQMVSTRDNDEHDESEKVLIKYKDYPNVLFSGQSVVENGLFEFTFMVPKDIRYNYGNGRIVYYACDVEAHEEAIGYFENFLIGGSSSVSIFDTIGPNMKLYLNNPIFSDGGKTYESPHFYAELYDENGINTVGSGIGHDLLLVVDEDPQLTYVLNDYFVAQNNSYQQGLVSFRMPELADGQHSLTFRAWDLLNNSCTEKLNFQVIKGLEPYIYQVLAYPNPVSRNGQLNFRVEYDQPDELVETEIYMYDVSGKLINASYQKGVEGIQWNMSEMNIAPGIYIYQVRIKTTTSDFVSKAGKIIVCE